VKIERCEAEGDLFAFWRQHANTDQYSGRKIELQRYSNEPSRPA
jgi:hypothetical protein